ncbi:MAG: LuxR C-terminal-related transcriptional regulator, partial [Gammaproteobacteria bacterium]|nr:LuxR C-terminal-related transcriptional regulator [Gammaproteobacteria bacterium]
MSLGGQRSTPAIPPTQTQNLSGKETEILTLVANGLSNKEIARVLSITLGTTKWHLRNIYDKLGVSSRTEAVFEGKA